MILTILLLLSNPAYAGVERRGLFKAAAAAAVRAAVPAPAPTVATPVVSATAAADAARIAALEAQIAAFQTQVAGFGQTRAAQLAGTWKDLNSGYIERELFEANTSSQRVTHANAFKHYSYQPHLGHPEVLQTLDVLLDWQQHNPNLAQTILNDIDALATLYRSCLPTDLKIEDYLGKVIPDTSLSSIPTTLLNQLERLYRKESKFKGTNAKPNLLAQVEHEIERREKEAARLENIVWSQVQSEPWASENWFRLFGERFAAMEAEIALETKIPLTTIHKLTPLVINNLRHTHSYFYEFVNNSSRMRIYSSEIVANYVSKLSVFSPNMAAYVYATQFHLPNFTSNFFGIDLSSSFTGITHDGSLRPYFSIMPYVRDFYKMALAGDTQGVANAYIEALPILEKAILHIESYPQSPLRGGILKVLRSWQTTVRFEFETLPQRIRGLVQHKKIGEENRTRSHGPYQKPPPAPEPDSPEWRTFGFATPEEARAGALEWMGQLQKLGYDMRSQIEEALRAIDDIFPNAVSPTPEVSLRTEDSIPAAITVLESASPVAAPVATAASPDVRRLPAPLVADTGGVRAVQQRFAAADASATDESVPKGLAPIGGGAFNRTLQIEAACADLFTQNVY